MIQDAFSRARRQASGFENGIRIQLRQILNNPKRSKYFSADELKIMTDIVEGTPGQNFAKLVGKLGFGEGAATNYLGGMIATGAGFTAGGLPGAVILPTIGTVSRRLAQRMTRNRAGFLDDVIRAGRDGQRITRAYLRHTPSGMRSPQDLAQLLMQPDVALQSLPRASFVQRAANLARQARNATAAAAVPAGAQHFGVLAPETQGQAQQ